MTKISDKPFMRLPEILPLLPFARSTWWDGISKGRYPKPVKLGPRISAWRTKDIEEFLASYNCPDPANAHLRKASE